MKNKYSKILLAWVITGVLSFLIFMALIISVSNDVLLTLLFSLVPIGVALLTVGWWMTAKKEKLKAMRICIFVVISVLTICSAGLSFFIGALAISMHPIESLLPVLNALVLSCWYVVFCAMQKNLIKK